MPSTPIIECDTPSLLTEVAELIFITLVHTYGSGSDPGICSTGICSNNTLLKIAGPPEAILPYHFLVVPIIIS